MGHQTKENHLKDKENPPLFGAWWKFYAAVIVWLALLIVFFYLFTRHFS